MSKLIEPKFVNMCKQGIIGAFLGILSGALLGVLIYWIQFPMLWLSKPDEFLNIYGFMLWQTAAQSGGLGAGAGAIIGSIFGSLQALKNSSNK